MEETSASTDLINENIVCPDMKKNTLEGIYNTLLNETNEIEIDIDTDKFHSANLYGKECGLFHNTTFIIDGVICSECDNAEGNDKYTNLDDNVEAMIARIKGYVEQ